LNFSSLIIITLILNTKFTYEIPTIYFFLLSATATDACCSPGSTARRPVQTTQQLASVVLFVPAASPSI
jgi:hypothetical protein